MELALLTAKELHNQAILPEQFFNPPAHVLEGRGEAALRWAVLADALNCFQKQFVSNSKQPLQIAKEAEEWLFSDDRDWPFSFFNICEALTIDASGLRSELFRWAKNSTKRARRAVTNSKARLAA